MKGKAIAKTDAATSEDGGAASGDDSGGGVAASRSGGEERPCEGTPPFKPFPGMPVLPYSPLRCRNCRPVLKPFSVVDFEAKIWICPICFHRNHFPPHHAASISPDTLSPELFSQYTTVEYQQDDASSPPPLTCLFVVDTCLLEEEIGFLRSALSQAMHLIPAPSTMSQNPPSPLTSGSE
ncbi:hypothetical protein Tsubulata_025392 [Turnera subulata]|uniref:Protein transport protein SEC23 n=1 Tax=Turnera subulata TaxID=218843 RepID=A0A9Q0FHI4_9ROSI|nr:hypothetical protein Tsubulata_025392 [Turnera subulata]